MRSRAWWAALVLVACGEAAPVPPGERDPRPSVVLITLDSVGADLLHFGGRVVAPNLAALGAAGLATEALSTTSWTLPAHVSIFTGVPELEHGVEQDGQCIPPDLRTLPERLKEMGYRTFGVYSGPYLDPRYGFERGFDSYVAGYGPPLARAARAAAEALERVHGADTPAEAFERLEENGDAAVALEVASHGDRSSQVVSDLAIEELRRAARDPRPFFLFAHYFDTHYDYDPPPPYDRMFDPDYAGTIDGKRYGYRLAEPLPSPRDLEHLKALQAGELAWTDAQIGRVLDTLEELGLAENTLVIVTADHGEEFGQHGRLGHRKTLYEEALRVPLLVRTASGSRFGDEPLRAGKGMSLHLLFDSILLEIPPGTTNPDPNEPGGLRGPREESFSRLVLNPTGAREDVRILEAWRRGSIKVLREASLASRNRPLTRWIDLSLHPDEPPEAWSEDFGDAAAHQALSIHPESPGNTLSRKSGPIESEDRVRRFAPLAPSTDDLLGAFRALGYAGQEARVGAIDPRELVLAPPEGR